MEKTKNCWVIPTDKPSRLFKLSGDLHLHTEESIDPKRNQNIYITSDEEIKNRDWCLYNKNHNSRNPDWILTKCGEIESEEMHPISECKLLLWMKKIILTTDQDLIKDGVQAIDDDFLEWFSSKNPTCEFVEIYQDKKDYGEFQWYSEYKIIFPKEKQKQILSEMMQEDEKSGLYDETLKLKRNYEKHSLTKTKGYKLWCNIIQRCYNPKNPSYKYYGEKGVIMEDYFKNSYENFINWIKGIAHYNEWLNSSELSLDRIDNTLGYSRGNIKFSTKTEQVENQNLRVDNKSGYKGVCYHKLNKKYSATITINKSKVFLGYYDTALEASLVYDNYVLKNNLNRKTNL